MVGRTFSEEDANKIVIHAIERADTELHVVVPQQIFERASRDIQNRAFPNGYRIVEEDVRDGKNNRPVVIARMASYGGPHS